LLEDIADPELNGRISPSIYDPKFYGWVVAIEMEEMSDHILRDKKAKSIENQEFQETTSKELSEAFIPKKLSESAQLSKIISDGEYLPKRWRKLKRPYGSD
jgi:hypothetical protein